MAVFSERYGYKTPKEVFLRESMPQVVKNVLCSAFEYLSEWFNRIDVVAHRDYDYSYSQLEEHLWVSVFRKRKSEYRFYRGGVVSDYLDSSAMWYEKLDLLESSLKVMRANYIDVNRSSAIDRFVNFINISFREIGYAYRIVDNEVVEITSDEEVAEIEGALKSNDYVATHLSSALEHISKRPIPDYRNSIKESISAVEFVCRELTSKTTLGEALKELNKIGIEIPSMLTVAFEKLYVYTNDKTTGIRHALMDGTNEPGFEEAKFMLVACCAFVNYLRSKHR